MQKIVWQLLRALHGVSVNFNPLLGERFFAAYLHITV